MRKSFLFLNKIKVLVFGAVLVLSSGCLKLAVNSQDKSKGGAQSSSESPQITTNVDVVKAVSLYQNNCAKCHGPLETSVKRGATADRIQGALKNVVPMQTISLTTPDVQLISWALNNEIPKDPKYSSADRFTCVESQKLLAWKKDLFRLSSTELRATLKNILGDATYQKLLTYINLYPFDSATYGATFQNSFSETHASGILEISSAIATEVVAQKATFVGACVSQATVTDVCIKDYIRKFGKKIFRRPLFEIAANNEVNRYYSIYLQGVDVNEGLELLTMALFQSPYFVMHVEEGESVVTESGQKKAKLTQYEIANRISYAITHSSPDAQLTASADNKRLGDLEVIRAEVVRLLGLSNTVSMDFLDYWLGLGDIPNGSFTSGFLGSVSGVGIKDEAVQELKAYFDYFWANSRSYQELMTSTYAFPHTDRLATIYQTARWASGMVPVQTVPLRKGLLGRVAMLLSETNDSNLIKRGVRIRRRVLCDNLPPPDSLALAQRMDQVQLDPVLYSARERVAALTRPDTCMACHTTINPIGFAFEQFDSIGRYRTVQKVFNANQVVAEHAIDPTVDAIIDTGFSAPVGGASELAELIASSGKGSACYIKSVYSYIQKSQDYSASGCVLENAHLKMTAATQPASLKNTMIDLLVNDKLLWKALED